MTKAAAALQTARDRYKGAWDQYPTFVDPSDEARFAARRTAEVNAIRAWLDVALCRYERAQTYDVDSADFKPLAEEASALFLEIYQTYRNQIAGLYARMWHAKCLEELSDVEQALGIFDELLKHPGHSPAMQTLRDRVRQVRLVGLNRGGEKDLRLAVDDA